MALATSIFVILGIGALMFWQFGQPPFLRKASMNTELAEKMDAELKKIPNIKVLNKEVTFTNVEYKGKAIANFSAVIMAIDTTISAAQLEAGIVEHLKQNLIYPYENIYQVFQINVVED